MDDNITEKIWRAAQVKSKTNEMSAEKYKEASKSRLKKIVETKLRTSFIGALSKFETFFGKLWGHGNLQLNKEELAWKALWDECRTEILNNGNTQLRAIQSEMIQYDIIWNKYQVTLKPIGGSDEKNI